MTKFKAKNSTDSAWDAFAFRGIYLKDAFFDIENIKEVRNFSFAEDVLYGRVDTQLNTI